MKRAFGDGFMQLRGRFPQRSLSLVALVIFDRSMDPLDKGSDASQDRPIAFLAFQSLTSCFDCRMMSISHIFLQKKTE